MPIIITGIGMVLRNRVRQNFRHPLAESVCSGEAELNRNRMAKWRRQVYQFSTGELEGMESVTASR